MPVRRATGNAGYPRSDSTTSVLTDAVEAAAPCCCNERSGDAAGDHDSVGFGRSDARPASTCTPGGRQVRHAAALGELDRHRLTPARQDLHRLVLVHADAGEQSSCDVPAHLDAERRPGVGEAPHDGCRRFLRGCGAEASEPASGCIDVVLDVRAAALVVGQVASAVSVGVEQTVDLALRAVERLGQTATFRLLRVA